MAGGDPHSRTKPAEAPARHLRLTPTRESAPDELPEFDRGLVGSLGSRSKAATGDLLTRG